MEGIGQNPVYYDLAFEMLTAKGPKELGEWIKKYVRRRYGTKDLNAEKAWELLEYNATALLTIWGPDESTVFLIFFVLYIFFCKESSFIL